MVVAAVSPAAVFYTAVAVYTAVDVAAGFGVIALLVCFCNWPIVCCLQTNTPRSHLTARHAGGVLFLLVLFYLLVLGSVGVC